MCVLSQVGTFTVKSGKVQQLRNRSGVLRPTRRYTSECGTLGNPSTAMLRVSYATGSCINLKSVPDIADLAPGQGAGRIRARCGPDHRYILTWKSPGRRPKKTSCSVQKGPLKALLLPLKTFLEPNMTLKQKCFGRKDLFPTMMPFFQKKKSI